jgi:polysaccharide export outer membrane protein
MACPPRPTAPAFAVALAAGLALLTGCGRGSDLPPLPRITAEYRLGPGDVIRIVTYGEEQLSGEFRVGDTGRVALPLLGAVPAAKYTPREFQEEVASRLREAGLLQAPSVSVEVTGYRPFYVLGEVNKPGQYAYQPGITVLGAVAMAGGFTYRAVEDYAGVVRVAEGRSLEGRAARRDAVQPGDVITIYERRF